MQEATMKPDRPLILSILSLAAGLSLIFVYGQGSAGMNAGIPVASSAVHLNISTSGPAALGGLALTALGVLLMAWALLSAIVSQMTHASDRADKDPERLFE
jgi:hypothetical protein